MGLGLILFGLCSLLIGVGNSQSNDAAVMQALKQSLNSTSQLGWTDSNPCKWKNVQCSGGRVTRIQIGNQKLTGSLPPSLNNLTSLQVFEAQNNQLRGALPSFSGLNSLQSVLLSGNGFTSIPPDFFNGMTSLQVIYLDNNQFISWTIPDSLTSASGLQTFSASSANISGTLPDFFDKFSSLTTLHLSFNYLSGQLPSSFSGSSLQSLWLNGQQSSSKLNGSIAVLQNMTQLTEVWLHDNSFSGPLPDFTGFSQLQNISVRANSLTGPVPDSLVALPSLKVVNLTNNLLQGKTPNFSNSVLLDLSPNSESFCLSDPGVDCDSRVTSLLNVAQAFGYPAAFAQSWKRNDPCEAWKGITCNNNGNITVVNFNGMGLTGTVPASLSQIPSLQTIVLSNNNLTGTIPKELTTLPNLGLLDLSNNQLYGQIPGFKSTVAVKTSGNVNIGKDVLPPGVSGSPGPRTVGGNGDGSSNGKKSSVGAIVGSVVGVVLVVLIGGTFFFCRNKCRRSGKSSSKSHSPYDMVIHPRRSVSKDPVKITIDNLDSCEGTKGSHHSGPSELHFVDAGNMVISIQVLRQVTNNFSESNILGRGGFGTVYEGVLHDGTRIAVKRMESNVITDKGLEEFKSEISVLSKVRHRHLVALLGYCLEGNERLLVYEHMPQGTLSRFLFGWKSEEGLKPLEWAKRLTIALDVARGVEYLHSLARQVFIHRDLKPSNILLGDDMRAKVADFGLVRHAPDGKASVATKLAGTFGYLAPEYAVTGKVTTKIDVYSFGVILMELITGRKALDETLQDDMQHLVPWFRRMLINKDTFTKAIDPAMDPDEETLASIMKVAELAGHCTAREPSQRPDMGHAVNVLSSLAELWRPSEPADPEDLYGIDYNISLPQVIQRWQALEGMSTMEGLSYIRTTSNTMPTRPSSFASGFASTEGR